MEGSPYYPPQLHRQQQMPPVIPSHYMMSSSSPHLLMSPPPLNHNSFPSSSSHSSQNYIYPPSFYQHAQQPFSPHAPHQIRQVRRYKTIKRLVQIPQGKLVLNCPVPIQYLERVPLRDPKEFNMMRYTAITCDANEFHQKNYTLRQEIMNRETEIAICITMYNEDEILLSRTLHGIMKNLTQLTKRYRSPIWGEHTWQKVVICIIADGREKIHPRVLDMLSVLGVYQEGIAKSTINEKPVHAHLYEYTSQLSLTPDLTYKGAINDIVPAQIIFCLKEKNQRKINSHRWFFQAICPVLQPNVCILMDVGTRPGPHSIYKLWLPFEKHRDIGGACGEVRAMTGKGGIYLLNPLVAAQNFEYKISNILDKPLESVLGYIQVLPGAFSAYRYLAIQNDMTGEGPLKKYFLGDTSSGNVSEGIFEANMYLAEDRILCYELVAKAQSQWRLHYVSGAYGETDVPFSIAEFISQRRRWLNGSFFAGVYSLVHWGKILETNHTAGRKFLLIIELIYLCINWLFSWFALGNFFLSFYILTGSLAVMEQPPFSSEIADIVHTVLTYIYAVLIICLFLISMGNRPQGSQGSYGLIMIFFSLLMIYVIFSSVWIVYIGISTELSKPQDVSSLLSNGPFRDIIISMASTFGVFVLSGIIFFDPWHMLTSFIQYFLLTPAYINILNTYAFCNTHDVSWGTKDIFENIPYLGHVETKADETTAEIVLPEQKDVGYLYEESFKNLQKKESKKSKKFVDPKTRQEDYYRNFRTRLVVCWIFTNLILVIVICTMNNLGRLGSFDDRTNSYMSFILWSVTGLSVFRFIGCLTIGLMGLDQTNLHVLIESGSPSEKENAKKVLALLERGKHWVLVTLLLSNVIVNETLPILLDGVLGGGWQAVVISTALIVIFGEVIPQSICVRHGLAIGAKTAWAVLILMYIMYPIAYPTALLLDFFLGESHGTVYKKAGLKSLVSLHQAVHASDVDALTSDEVTIIGAVLDLKSKPVSFIMTPMNDVFTLSTEDILNEELVDKILTAGYSRIPVHTPEDKENFIGMLLTKRLITYDPEDALPMKQLPLSTLPETGPDTSCLDILNFFQEGKSHMAIVSSDPGGSSGALGVITLEDVIEELIGEEIIDETDVYVDVRNKIRVVRRQMISKRNTHLTARKKGTTNKIFPEKPSYGAI
ncbi:hypothetical protein INT46_008367 [Mucor plumbeus]|uniref:chitin synthase n=1 Tax=Mucor plumbeus TaxID=97098 RepID=A0A8H7QTA6_9FUNG|nr:hypothetical protein INT46_008367 [Mucor plumbeus]